MADARLLHKKGIHGERVIALGHLEFRVWVQYVLSADDYGVMRASATVLRADNLRLEREPFKRIVAAMLALEEIGLVQIFEHQGVKFWWQNDWQDFQGIRYPRDTVNPSPPAHKIATATIKTQHLFGLRSKASQKDSGNDSEMTQIPAGAGGRETHTLTANTQGSGSLEEGLRETVGSSRDGGIFNGSEARHHGSHEWCSWPKRDGLCVPAFLHREFTGKLGHADAHAALRAWYPGEVSLFEGVAVGEDSIRFWRNRFARWVGQATTAPASVQDTKASLAVEAFDRADAALEQAHARRAEEAPRRPQVVGRGTSSQGR